MSSSEIPTSLEHHYIIYDIITWCPNDVMPFFGRNVCACTWYAEWIPLLRAKMPKCMLSFPLYRVGNSRPSAQTVTYIYHRHRNWDTEVTWHTVHSWGGGIGWEHLQMCRQVGMTLLNMCKGFPAYLEKQMIMTSFHDVTVVLFM